MTIFIFWGGDICDNIDYYVGRNIWHHSIMYGARYVAIFIIVWKVICGNIQYCVGQHIFNASVRRDIWQ